MRFHPVRWSARPDTALDPAACERSGHRGPFLNGDLYDSFPGWEGYGECAQCGSTVLRVPATAPRRGYESRPQPGAPPPQS